MILSCWNTLVCKERIRSSLHPTIRKVFYYLNGTQSGKYYAAPFTWGGTGGFDTLTLANGNYILSGAYTDNAGDHAFSLTFTVRN